MNNQEPDKWSGDPQILRPMCTQCKHRHEKISDCDAFPKGIPIAIIRGQVQHLKSISGDNGIVYKPK